LNSSIKQQKTETTLGTNVSTNYISCPADPKKTLGIKLPFLVMIIKNVQTLFSLLVFSLTSLPPSRRLPWMITLDEEVFHVRSASIRRQKRPQKIPGVQLPDDNKGEAFHLHDADEA
jgi:hypothetical protein